MSYYTLYTDMLFVHFTIYDTKHNPSRNYKMHRRKSRFSIIMGLQSAYENELYGFGNVVIWHWKSFDNPFRSLCERCITCTKKLLNELCMAL